MFSRNYFNVCTYCEFFLGASSAFCHEFAGRFVCLCYSNPLLYYFHSAVDIGCTLLISQCVWRLESWLSFIGQEKINDSCWYCWGIGVLGFKMSTGFSRRLFSVRWFISFLKKSNNLLIPFFFFSFSFPYNIWYFPGYIQLENIILNVWNVDLYYTIINSQVYVGFFLFLIFVFFFFYYSLLILWKSFVQKD